MQLSLAQLLGNAPLSVEVRPSVLYNPSTRSANFFIPGLIAVLLQIMIILMIALSLVRERERGTLDQLTMTPVTPLGLMVGKLIPYGVMAFGELCVILIIMQLISTKATTQAEAFQLAMATVLPSIFLSGYIFQIETMPPIFAAISRIIPTTYYIRILRGIILRGAGFHDLWLNALILLVMGCVAILAAASLFVRQRRG
jgi:ABC-2 type transport system permease protein